MPRLTIRNKRIQQALKGLRPGMLVELVRDTFDLRTNCSPRIGAVCKVLKIDKKQKDLQVQVQNVAHPSKIEWCSVLDLEPTPSHWHESMFRKEGVG